MYAWSTQWLLPKYQDGFREGFSRKHCLLVMMEKLQKAWISTASAVLLTDLSKVFDSVPHDLLIANLYAHGVK